MARQLLADLIRPVVQSGGGVAIPAGRVTFGSRQFSFNALSANFPTLTANTRYFVYLVRNGSLVQLVISTNVNSAGPGFADYLLVGAFYSNGVTVPGFGSLVNILGEPTTGWIETVATIIGVTGFAFPPRASWYRKGDSCYYKLSLTKDANAGVSGATFEAIAPFSLDTSRELSSAAGTTAQVGGCLNYRIDGQVGFDTEISAIWGGGASLRATNTASGSSIVGTDFGTNAQLVLNAVFPAIGFDVRQLKDL